MEAEAPVPLAAEEPLVAPAPETAEVVTDQNTEEPAPSTEPEAKPEEPTPEQEAKREQRRAQNKLEKAYRQRAEALARAEFLEKQLNETRKQVVQDPAAPKIEDFSDIEDFRKAVDKHAYERGLKESDTRRQQETQQRQISELTAVWDGKADKGSKKYEDFDEIVGELKPTTPWALAIMEADNGEDIAYYLGTHIAEAKAIATLNPLAQARAIGKLETKLLSEPVKQKTPSKAPAPITPLGGKSGGSSDLPQDTDDIKTWMKKENARMRKMAS